MSNSKYVFIIVQIVLIQNMFSQKHEEDKALLYTIEGTLTRSSQYCGGIHPSREEEAEFTRAKPLHTKVYVRKGKRNSTKTPLFDSTTTDANGHYTFHLPPGNYVVLMPIQKNKKILRSLKKIKSKTLHVNMLCAKGWWLGGLYKIKVVDKNISGLDHQFHHRCFVPYPIPCIDYSGPYPP
jgi:hypothetical protein